MAKSKLLIDNYRGRYVPPFTRTTVKGTKVACRFCHQRVRRLEMGHEKPTPKQKEKYMMPVGTDCVHLITSTGPVGDAYICIPCAKQLLENLERELEK